MRQGGFGDFSFPAGRSYCDPKLKAPFSCLPLPLARAYDDPRSEPRPIGRGAEAMRPERFFIWNSSLPASYSSLDTYSAATRKMLQTPEQVVAEWLRKSPVFEGQLLLKTHAHSLSREYRLTEPDSAHPALPTRRRAPVRPAGAGMRAGAVGTALSHGERGRRLPGRSRWRRARCPPRRDCCTKDRRPAGRDD